MSMMRFANPEDESVIPRISPIRFTKEKNVRLLDLSVDFHVGMLDFEDHWKVVGWAHANDVAPRELCNYVAMLEDEDGFQYWCHFATVNIEVMADKVRENPDRVVSKR